MTQEDKDLLIKDLCARLPYELKIHAKYVHTVNDTVIETDGTLRMMDDNKFVSFTDDNSDRYFYHYVAVHDIKPYLFPLSSMTEEQIYEIKDIIGENFEIDKYGITDLIRNRRTFLSYLELDALFNYFNKNHFDYRGLIENGLALDVTGLNIY